MEAIQIAATVFSVVRSISGGNDQARAIQEQGAARQQQAEAAARANEYDAAVKRQRADQELALAGQREESLRRQARLDAGRRRAAIAQARTGSGSDTSNFDIDYESAIAAELDALNIRYEGQLNARGLLQGAQMDDYSAASARQTGESEMAMARSNAERARTGGYMGAVGAALGGVGDYMKNTRKRVGVNAPSGPTLDYTPGWDGFDG